MLLLVATSPLISPVILLSFCDCISPTVYTFRFTGDYLIPKSSKCSHSATKGMHMGLKISGFGSAMMMNPLISLTLNPKPLNP